jgi:hypothetical protein
VTTFFGTGRAFADRMPIGGRTATMGGAAVAAGNDSAMPYLNPAGLAGVPGGVFGISATIYGYQRLRVDHYFLPAGYDPQASYGTPVARQNEMSSSVFMELPSSIMYFARSGKLSPATDYKLGLALVSPEVERREMVGNYLGTFPQSSGILNESLGVSLRRTDYYVGPSVAFGVGESLRLGLSAFAYYSRTSNVTARAYDLSIQSIAAAGGQRMSLATTQESVGFVPVVGLQVSPASHFWLGAGIALPSLPLWGRHQEVGSVDAYLPDANGNEIHQRLDTVSLGEYRQESPLRTTLGVAWDDRERFSAALDVTYRAKRPKAVEYPLASREVFQRTGEIKRVYNNGDASHVTLDLEQRVDVAVGFEVALGRMFALRAGGFTDFANTPEITGAGTDLRRIRLDHLGTSLGLGIRVSPLDTTLGAVYMHGIGSMGAWDLTSGVARASGARIVPTDAEQHSIFFVLSGTVTQEEARDQMQQALGAGQLPNLPDAQTRGLKYQSPPYGPGGLKRDDRPKPLRDDPSALPAASPAPTAPPPTPPESPAAPPAQPDAAAAPEAPP